MKNWRIVIGVIALTFMMTVSPAYAQGNGLGNDAATCFGGNSTIGGEFRGKDVLMMGCNGRIREGAVIPGNVAVFGSNLIIEKGARVNGRVAVVGGNLELGGQVDGDIAVTGGAVQLDSSAVVGGNVQTVAGGLTQREGAVVHGSISRQAGPSMGSTFGRGLSPVPGVAGITNGVFSAGLGFLRGVVIALALAALGILLVILFPEPTRRIRETAENSTAYSLGAGCLTLLLTPILFIVLAITLIGIPVALLLGLVAAVASVVGWIAVGYWAGYRILEGLKVHEIVPIVAVIVGVLILALVSQVPLIGWLAWLLITTVGVGAVVLTRFGTRVYPYAPAFLPAIPSGYPPAAPARPAEPSAVLPAGGEPPPAREISHPDAPEPPKE